MMIVYMMNLYHKLKKFKKYETECSLNDPRLLLEDDTCELKEHEHGGHPCNSEGKWDLTKCEAYYCDLGYYYDQYLKKCVIDVCTNGNETEYYLNDSYIEPKEFLINPDKDEEFVFYIKNTNYYYFFSGNVNNLFYYYSDTEMINKNNFLMAQYISEYSLFPPQVDVNYFHNLKENAKIKITAVPIKPKTFIYSIYDSEVQIYGYDINNDNYNFLSSIQSPNQHIIYSTSYNKDTKSFYMLYSSDINPNDIIDTNTNIYKYTLNKLTFTKENEVGIFSYHTSPNISSIYILVIPKNINQDISISNQRFLYLNKKDKDYNLIFSSNKNFYIKLINETLNAEIEILEDNKKLNIENRYVLFDKSKKKSIFKT